MEVPFARDGIQRSSLNTRIDRPHQPMYNRLKSPAVATAHDAVPPPADGYYNRHFGDQQAGPERQDNAYENLLRQPRYDRRQVEMISPPKPPRGQVNTERMERPSPSKTALYRSNSNLDLDRVSGDHISPTTNLGREYGSTSSLDLLAEADGTKQSFFAIVRNYNKGKTADKSPAAPKLQQILRGTNNNNQKQNRPTTINIPSPVNTFPDELDSSPPSKQQVKVKTKAGRRSSGADGPSLFQKLRGVRADSTDLKSPTDSDERVRRKVFVHYDTQSLTFRLTDSNKNSLSGPKRRNTVAGASAASVSIEDPSLELEDDDGDERSNQLLVSCPFFRNEICMEDGVLPKYTSSMHHIHRFVVEGRRCYKACRQSICNAVAVLDTSVNSLGVTGTLIKRHKSFVVEHADYGAAYYRNFFSPYEHHNYYGIDDQLGPVAISLRREACMEKVGNKPEARFQYRVILRTSELATLRGTVAEDSIPTPARISASRGIPAKDVLDFVCPELNLSTLRLGDKRLSEQLMKLDEMGLAKSYKVGLLLCRQGQNTEEEMYNNENSTPAFEEFVNLLGRRVRLKGFEGFRGGLDTKTDSTGKHSIHAVFLDYEMMFHVSTLLPFTPDNKQQLMRKCHIGNDIVTIVFQEPGALPFSPKTMRSHFQHVFIVVRVNHPCSERTTYQVAVSRSKEVPAFGPPLPEDSIFPKSQEFTDYLLTKIINGENAVHKSQRFTSMSIRTRQEYLRHLAEESQSGASLDQVKVGKFQSGSGRKKDRGSKNKTPVSEYTPRGGSSWQVQVEDPGIGQHLNAVLGVSETMVLLVDEAKRNCVFALPCDSVIGWTELANSLRLYYNHGECLVIRVLPGQQTENDIHDIIQRLSAVTLGAPTSEISLQRNQQGQLGFHVQAEGIVSEVDPSGPAWNANLRTNCRIVEVGKFKTSSLSLDQLIDILRAAQQIRVVTVPPLGDGSLRKGCEECRVVFSSQPHYLLPTVNAAEMDSKSVGSVRSEHSSERSDPNTSLTRQRETPSETSPREPERSVIPASRRDFEEAQKPARDYRQPARDERYHDYREEKRWEEKKSPRDQYLDISATEASFESRGSGRGDAIPDATQFKDGRRPYIPSSPRVSRAPKPTEALRERSFQEELMRLISPDLLPERTVTADRAKSEENIHSSNKYEDSSHRLTKEQRLSPRATAFRTSQNSVFKKPADPVPLLENTSSLDWSHLVDTANRLVEQTEPERSVAKKAVTRPDKLSVRAVQSSSPWRPEQGRSPEKRIRDLQNLLEDERRKREELEFENDELRRDNERLQEESQAAAAQLRRFTQWFFSTMDRQ